jgi:DNA-binding beta-propeller fold protein YncE
LFSSRLIRGVAAVLPAAALVLAAAPPGSALAAPGSALAAAHPAGIKTAEGPEAIAADTENGTTWVADNEGESVTEIAGGKVRATISLGTSMPLDIAVDSRTGTVWVADGEGGSVTEISAATGHILHTITLSQADAVANGIAVDPVHGKVFVTELDLGNLVEFSESHPTSQHVVAAGNTPLRVAVDSTARTAWVTDQAATVTEVSYSGTQPKVIGTLPISGGGITADSTTGLIFVAEYNAGAVAIINASTRKFRTVKVGPDPAGLAADPAHGDVWVADGSDRLSQIRESTGKVAATYPVGFSSASVAVQPGAGVFAADFLANSVTFLAAGVRVIAPRSATFRTGRHGAVVVRATGFPAASVRVSGRLPAGLRWSASGANGRIAGTPARRTEGTYHLVLRASTSWGLTASRRLTLKVR